MNTVPVSHPVVNLFADEWQPHNVADFARFALRQPGTIAPLGDNLQASAYKSNDRTRIWIIEDAQGNVLAEEPSLYKAIQKIAA